MRMCVSTDSNFHFVSFVFSFARNCCTKNSVHFYQMRILSIACDRQPLSFPLDFRFRSCSILAHTIDAYHIYELWAPRFFFFVPLIVGARIICRISYAFEVWVWSVRYVHFWIDSRWLNDPHAKRKTRCQRIDEKRIYLIPPHTRSHAYAMVAAAAQPRTYAMKNGYLLLYAEIFIEY